MRQTQKKETSDRCQKLDAVVHYICHGCEDRGKLGKTKLNKILFFADRFFYEVTERTLTGESYTRERYGPVPIGLRACLARLDRSKKLITRRTDFHGHPKDEFISLVEPDLSDLSKEEIIFLVKLADFICNEHTAQSISEVSHDIVWNSAEEGETIPMNAYLASKAGEIRQSDRDWAENIV